jgi:hypothetical protein
MASMWTRWWLSCRPLVKGPQLRGEAWSRRVARYRARCEPVNAAGYMMR